MTKKIKFKRGQLVQHTEDGTIYIFIKYTIPKKSHLVELDNFGNPMGIVLIENKYLDIPKKFPETFNVILV